MEQKIMKKANEFQSEHKIRRFRRNTVCFLSAVVLVVTVLLLMLPAVTLEQSEPYDGKPGVSTEGLSESGAYSSFEDETAIQRKIPLEKEDAGVLLAKAPDAPDSTLSYSKTVEKIISPSGDQYRLMLSVSAPQDNNTRYTHIFIEDIFSSFAHPIDSEALLIEVTDKTGELSAYGGPAVTLPATSLNPAAVVTAAYDAVTGKMTLTFPENYILEDGWNYCLSTLVQPTDVAYETYIGNPVYPHTGDEGTGTLSSNQAGFYSNQSATLQYMMNDEPLTTAYYPLPVIQVNVAGCEGYQGTNTHVHGLRLGKYVEKLSGENDDYKLNITLSGPLKKEKTKVNVLFVIDTTTSMSASMNGSYNNSYERWYALENAIDYMTEDMENLEGDPRYSMIWFNGRQSTAQNPYKDAGTACGWTSNRAGFMSTVRSYRNKLTGYTNYEAACYELVNIGTLINTARCDAKNIVVFVSDGQPNTYYLSDGSSAPYSPNSELTVANARARLNNITNVAAFFTVGVGKESDFVRLERMAADLPAKGIVTGHYVCSDKEAVRAAFENMIDVVFKPKYSGVTLTDGLSEYAKLADNTPYTLQVQNEKGETVMQAQGIYGQTDTLNLTLPATELNGEAALVLNYDEEKRQFVLSFPDSYILESEWSYRISANIKPTDFAYETYSQNGYEHIGDKGTGVTSTLQRGFYCNTEAVVTYRFNDEEPETQLYPKPVIQVLTAAPGYRLPDTGGAGTLWFSLAGALLAGVFITGCYIRRRSKNKKS